MSKEGLLVPDRRGGRRGAAHHAVSSPTRVRGGHPVVTADPPIAAHAVIEAAARLSVRPGGVVAGPAQLPSAPWDARRESSNAARE